MRSAQRAGHECGLHAWDHVLWQDKVRHRDAAWTVRQMELAFDRFVDVFGRPPSSHGAAGWQMNAAAFRQIDHWGLAYASDGRGSAPFVPVVDGAALGHVQLPTTLPTLDELIGRDGIDEGNVVQHLLALTGSGPAPGPYPARRARRSGAGAVVHGVDPRLEGARASPRRLDDAYRATPRSFLARRPVDWCAVPGRSGEVIGSAAD